MTAVGFVLSFDAPLLSLLLPLIKPRHRVIGLCDDNGMTADVVHRDAVVMATTAS